MCHRANIPRYRFLSHTLHHNQCDNPLTKITTLIREKQGATKFMVYRSLNSTLSLHQVYSSKQYIPDYQCQAFTRLRVISHSLKIERGRWSRAPPDIRLCTYSSNVVHSAPQWCTLKGSGQSQCSTYIQRVVEIQSMR